MDCSKLNKGLTLIFDFDGTMCQIFKNYNLDNTIALLVEKMSSFDIKFSSEKDSFDVFEEIVKQTENKIEIRKTALNEANNILSIAELEAVATGEIVKGVDVIIPQLIENNIPIGISTNNSSKCVLSFLRRYMPSCVIPTIGRIGDEPELMKPNPYSILEVLKKMNCTPANAIFIGDSLRDYQGAMNAGCQFIGMAPTEKKRYRLLKVIPESNIVTNFYELVNLLASLNKELDERTN